MLVYRAAINIISIISYSLFVVNTMGLFTLSHQIRDLTSQPGAKGCRVVEAVIERIESSGIFKPHNFMLNRNLMFKSYLSNNRVAPPPIIFSIGPVAIPPPPQLDIIFSVMCCLG